jgi:hypothetical protein
MNPYRSRPAATSLSRPRPTPHPLAGRTIRSISTGIDFVMLLTLNFVLCSSYIGVDEVLEDVCGLLPYLFLVVYEVVLGTSIGKQLLGLKVHFELPGFRYRVYRTALKYVCIPFLVYPSMFFTARRQGLHDKAARSLVVHPNGWRVWARASMGILFAAYAMVTFGCGQLVGAIVRQRYDARLVSRVPDPWQPEPGGRDRWHRIWLQRGSFELPAERNGLPLRGTPYLYFFASSRSASLEGAPAIVMPGSDAHPVVELCHNQPSFLKWLLPCADSPREFQSAIFETTDERQLFLDPRSLLRNNSLRIVKNLLLKGDHLVALRSYHGPEFSAVWHTIRQLGEEGDIRLTADYINIGGDQAEEHYAITILWRGEDRDEAMVASLIGSFRFDRGSEELAASLFAEGRRRRSPLPLLNAIEIAKDKLPAAEAMYRLYARGGPDLEKRQFASWVSHRVEEGDLRFLELNEKVWDWRANEDVEEER